MTSLLLLLPCFIFLAAAAAAVDPPAPQLFTVEFVTDISDTPIIIQVTRSLAPLGADRFFALVQDGFYNQSALFRVVPDFVLQFGISALIRMRSGFTMRSKTTQWLEAIQEGQSALRLPVRTQGQLNFLSTMETTVGWTAWALHPLERW